MEGALVWKRRQRFFCGAHGFSAVPSEAESKEFHTMCPAVSRGLQEAGAPWHWSIRANMGWIPLRDVKDRIRSRRHFCFAGFHFLMDVNFQDRRVRTLLHQTRREALKYGCYLKTNSMWPTKVVVRGVRGNEAVGGHPWCMHS